MTTFALTTNNGSPAPEPQHLAIINCHLEGHYLKEEKRLLQLSSAVHSIPVRQTQSERRFDIECVRGNVL